MSKFNLSVVKGFGHAIKTGAKRRSPEILMAFGTVGFVTTTVVACVQTRKLDEILTDHEEKLDRIRKIRIKSEEIGEPQHFGKETAMVYGNTVFRIARLYALPLTIAATSLFCFFGANRILKNRALQAAANATAIAAGFKQYRERVAERFGDEVERQIRHGVTTKEVEEVVVDEDGTEKVVKTTCDVADGVQSPYQRYFTRRNEHWDHSPDTIKFFLLSEQNALNDLLKHRARTSPFGIGYVTFNEVLERLGFDIPMDGTGLRVGWIFDKRNPLGDNYIEFDVMACKIPGEDGRLEPAYSIDFNVDGDIWKELHERDLARRGRAS